MDDRVVLVCLNVCSPAPLPNAIQQYGSGGRPTFPAISVPS
jgi:hypothetical protein